ncbi:MAG: hypothetical protein ACOC2W_04500, partial [bacterium]
LVNIYSHNQVIIPIRIRGFILKIKEQKTMKTLITITVFFLMSFTLIGQIKNPLRKNVTIVNSDYEYTSNETLKIDKNNVTITIKNNKTLIINTDIEVFKNGFEIIVETGSTFIINGNITFVGFNGNGENRPDMIINGESIINGNISGNGTINGTGNLTVSGTVDGNIDSGGFTGDLIGTNRTAPTNPTWEIINNGNNDFSVKLNWEFSNKNTLSLFIIKKDDSIIGNTTNLTYTDSINLSGESTPVYKIYALYSDGVSSEPLVISFIDSPLPIELISFKSIENENSIKLEWVTATEINNDYFVIEKSEDLKNWEVVSYVQGAGNSNTLLTYSIEDFNPIQGVSYYRLTQHDFDGKFEVFNPISTYWNPYGNFKVKIYDLMGNLIKEDYISSINNYIIPKFGKPVIVIFYSDDEMVKTVKSF